VDAHDGRGRDRAGTPEIDAGEGEEQVSPGQVGELRGGANGVAMSTFESQRSLLARAVLAEARRPLTLVGARRPP